MNGKCRGYMFRNESTIRSYVDCVSSGNIPITTGRIIDDEELLAASYATGLRNGRIENNHLRKLRSENHELSEHYQTLENMLRGIGILETYIDDNGTIGLGISTLGKLFEDEVLALFFSPPVKRALARKASGGYELIGLGPSDLLARAL